MNDFLKLKKDIEKDTVKVNAVLNPDSLSIKAIQEQLNKEKLNINIGNVTFNPSEIDSSIDQATNQVQQKLNNAMSQMTMNVHAFDIESRGQYETLLAKMGLGDKEIRQATREIEQLGIQIDKISATNYNNETGKISAIIQGTDALGRMVTVTRDIKTELNEAGDEEIKLGNQVVTVTTNYKKQQEELAKISRQRQSEIEKTNKELQQQQTYMAKIQQQAESIKAANSDRKNALNGVESTNVAGMTLLSYTEEAADSAKEYVNAFNELQYKVAEYNVQLANSNTLTEEQKRTLDSMLANVRLLGTNAKSIQSTATSNRSKDVGKQVETEREKLGKFELEVEKSDIKVDEFKARIQTLKETLNNVGTDANAFGKWQDELDVVKASFQRAKEEATQFANVAKQLDSLETFSKQGILGKSANNAGVQDLNNKIAELRENWTKLQVEMDSADSPEAMETARAKAQELSKAIANTAKEAKELKANLTEVTSATKLATEKQNFGNRIDNWLKENTKASESLRQKMIQLKAEMESADDVRFTELKKEFAALNNYAKATGQTGKSMFDTIKEKIGKFTGWFTIANAIMTITNYAKQSIGVLHEMDDIMTEISKTSDMSAESLKQLGETAFDAANKYGVTVQSYLTGVQEMSRAGYDEAAESMANLAILAQAAGDMTAQTAQDYLIATDAAYQLAGSEEKLSKILDGQNQITNNYAISMTDMAEATKEAASMASNYGVSVEQLSALITMAVSRTRQSGSEAGNALKALFVNLSDISNQERMKAFDKVGVDLYKIVDGAKQLKTPIEILGELSEVFNSLPEGDDRKNTILNEIGGRHHANTLAAILQDWQSMEGIMNTYYEGMGSAEKEANNCFYVQKCA